MRVWFLEHVSSSSQAVDVLVCLRWLCLQIHWFSIVNSCVTVLLLTGFLATILMRVLKADFIKYTRDDEAGEPVTTIVPFHLFDILPPKEVSLLLQFKRLLFLPL